MTVTLFELSKSRGEKIANDGNSAELIYRAVGDEDEAAIKSAADATLPSVWNSLVLQQYTTEHLGGGVWEIVATYGPLKKPDQNNPTFSFDTTGGNVTITQSDNTTRYAPVGKVAPDFKGAINVEGDTVKGVSIHIPKYAFTEKHILPASTVTSAYKATLYDLTGKINDASFKGFNAGEVLFLGARGSTRSEDEWEITYSFAASKNETGLTFGDITGVNKDGWQYLWVYYVESEDSAAKQLIKKPAAVYVEDVYESGDFSLLGIGT